MVPSTVCCLRIWCPRQVKGHVWPGYYGTVGPWLRQGRGHAGLFKLMCVSFIPFLPRRCLCLIPSVANGARACALGCQAVVVVWPMGPGLAHWVAKQLLLCGQWGQGLRTGLPSSCCCVANGARACALGCQAVVVVWPMGPGLEHWVAKRLLLCGQLGQGLRTGLPSSCCCVANGARA